MGTHLVCRFFVLFWTYPQNLKAQHVFLPKPIQNLCHTAFLYYPIGGRLKGFAKVILVFGDFHSTLCVTWEFALHS